MFSAELMKFITSSQMEDVPTLESKRSFFERYDVREIFYAPRKPVRIPVYRDK